MGQFFIELQGELKNCGLKAQLAEVDKIEHFFNDADPMLFVYALSGNV